MVSLLVLVLLLLLLGLGLLLRLIMLFLFLLQVVAFYLGLLGWFLGRGFLFLLGVRCRLSRGRSDLRGWLLGSFERWYFWGRLGFCHWFNFRNLLCDLFLSVFGLLLYDGGLLDNRLLNFSGRLSHFFISFRLLRRFWMLRLLFRLLFRFLLRLISRLVLRLLPYFFFGLLSNSFVGCFLIGWHFWRIFCGLLICLIFLPWLFLSGRSMWNLSILDTGLLHLVFLKLFEKSCVWPDHFSFFLNQSKGFLETQPTLFYEIGSQDCGGSRDTREAALLRKYQCTRTF